jgi:D-alanine transaminase
MSRIAYVNGSYVPHGEAVVHVEDRGYQFADGVYEVIALQGGRLIERELHLDRLGRSLGELQIDWPMSRAALSVVMAECVRRNRVREGIVYIQMTRGVARRDHAFPQESRTSVVITARSQTPSAKIFLQGVKVVSVPDIRWRRCDIKSVSLLPNILAKQIAKEKGGYEAWQVDPDGYVTEGSSTNAWIIDQNGAIVTRHLENAILSGITRLMLVDLARRDGIELIERAFTLEEGKEAREAFLTSTTSFVLPVVQIDDRVIGNGQPGSVTLRLREIYENYVNVVEEETNAA